MWEKINYRSDYDISTLDLQKSQEATLEADLDRLYFLESYYAGDVDEDEFRDKIIYDIRLRVYYRRIDELIERGSRGRWEKWRYIRFVSHNVDEVDKEASLKTSWRRMLNIKRQAIWKILTAKVK